MAKKSTRQDEVNIGNTEVVCTSKLVGGNRRETIPRGPCRDAYKPDNVSIASKPGARNPKSGGTHDRNLRDCNVQDRAGSCVIRGTIGPYGKCREGSAKRKPCIFVNSRFSAQHPQKKSYKKKKKDM